MLHFLTLLTQSSVAWRVDRNGAGHLTQLSPPSNPSSLPPDASGGSDLSVCVSRIPRSQFMHQERASGKLFILIEFDTDILVLSFGLVGVRAAADIILNSPSRSERVINAFKDLRHFHCTVRGIESACVFSCFFISPDRLYPIFNSLIDSTCSIDVARPVYCYPACTLQSSKSHERK
jgi:hypothetical protein